MSLAGLQKWPILDLWVGVVELQPRFVGTHTNIDDAICVLPLPVHFAILKAGRQKRPL